MDPFEAGNRPGHRREGEDVVDAAWIGARRRHAGSEDCLDFRAEQEPIPLPGPIERADAEPVPAQHQAALALVPERYRKLAPQPLEHPFLPLLPEVRDDLRIAMGDEPMATLFELRFPLGVIE